MSTSLGRAAFDLSFRISPIILTNGIAQNVPGGLLPIISITEALNFTVGLLSGGDNINLDNFFAHFQPLAGSSLVDNQIGTYPFANQSVAANAIIAQPLAISLLMICPAKGQSGFATKLATMMALQAALKEHNNSGGTYTIATPSYFYTNCVMIGMKDVSNPDSKQPQNAYQFDFLQPLLTLEQAQVVQNSLMQKLSDGTKVTDPTWSGLSTNVGSLSSIAGPTLIPAGSGPAGAGVAAAK